MEGECPPVTHAVFAPGLAIDSRGLITVSSDWAGRVRVREMWPHGPVAQKKGEEEGRLQQSKNKAAGCTMKTLLLLLLVLPDLVRAPGSLHR